MITHRDDRHTCFCLKELCLHLLFRKSFYSLSKDNNNSSSHEIVSVTVRVRTSQENKPNIDFSSNCSDILGLVTFDVKWLG